MLKFIESNIGSTNVEYGLIMTIVGLTFFFGYSIISDKFDFVFVALTNAMAITF